MSAIAGALATLVTVRYPLHDTRMTRKRATERPEKFAKPEHWSNDPPPKPKAGEVDEKLSPTRYGDWVKEGIAVDF